MATMPTTATTTTAAPASACSRPARDRPPTAARSPTASAGQRRSGSRRSRPVLIDDARAGRRSGDQCRDRAQPERAGEPAEGDETPVVADRPVGADTAGEPRGHEPLQGRCQHDRAHATDDGDGEPGDEHRQPAVPPGEPERAQRDDLGRLQASDAGEHQRDDGATGREGDDAERQVAVALELERADDERGRRVGGCDAADLAGPGRADEVAGEPQRIRPGRPSDEDGADELAATPFRLAQLTRPRAHERRRGVRERGPGTEREVDRHHADPDDRDLLADEPELIDEVHLVADTPTGRGHEVGVHDRLVDARRVGSAALGDHRSPELFDGSAVEREDRPAEEVLEPSLRDEVRVRRRGGRADAGLPAQAAGEVAGALQRRGVEQEILGPGLRAESLPPGVGAAGTECSQEHERQGGDGHDRDERRARGSGAGSRPATSR